MNCALILTYLLHLLYCFALTTIHEIYMLQVESNRWNLIFLCVASMPLLWIIALWVNSYARLIDACLEVLFMKSLCFMIQLFTHVITIVLIAAFITYAYNSMIKFMMACHSRNYLCYRLPARDEQELSLGMLIRLRRIDNFLCSMPHYWWYLHVLCILYVIFMHFPELTYWRDAEGPVAVFCCIWFQKS